MEADFLQNGTIACDSDIQITYELRFSHKHLRYKATMHLSVNPKGGQGNTSQDMHMGYTHWKIPST